MTVYFLRKDADFRPAVLTQLFLMHPFSIP